MFELDSRDIEHSDDIHTGYRENGKKGTWATIVGWDKLLLVFAAISLLSIIAMLFVLLTRMLHVVFGFMGLHFAEWSGWQAWIMGWERGLIIAASFGLIAILFALLARYRLRCDYSVYVEAGCPQCHEHELIRVRRNRRDRALGKLGLPVRRYSCRNCTWHGVRLAGYRYPAPDEGSEGFMVDQFEDEMVDSRPETVVESLPMVEVEADVETGMEGLDDGLNLLR
jgi:predicted RNA-binding Zn-ribbon protein involved in translation (DUF1610 family)